MTRTELDSFVHTLRIPVVNHLYHELQFEEAEFLKRKAKEDSANAKLYEAAVKLGDLRRKLGYSKP